MTLLIVTKDADTKRLERLDDLLPKNTQRFGRMGRHEHAFPLCQQMAEEIGDGVRLTGSRRPLNKDAISARELLGDFKLLSIGRFVQEHIVILVPE